MTWTAGYNSSVAYTTGYYQEQSPSFLNACLVMQRVQPPSLEKFTYCELGFGQGLTSLILAATHPTGEFYACDFNPLHVLNASSIRDEARLPNLTLLENGFGELAEGKVDLPLFDYITLHGIISWVSDQTRAQIMQFLTRYLKPGGVVQVSYNAMVGCAQIMPLQRLLTLGAGKTGGWSKANELVTKVKGLEALHFLRNPDSRGRAENFDNQDKNYLIHEYLHEKWTPFHFTDIAREMTEAKLSFAGSARFSHMTPVAWLTDSQREMLETLTDPLEAEEVRDYFVNRAFRSDIFVRGKAPLSDARLREQAQHVYLWGNSSAAYKPEASLEHATITRADSHHKPLFDLLRRSETTLAQVFDSPEFAGLSLDAILGLLRLSIAVGETAVRYGAEQPRVAADRLNAVLLSRVERGEVWGALASVRQGGGAGISTLDQLIFATLNEKTDPQKALAKDTKELVARLKRSMVATGLKLRIGDVEVADKDIDKRLGHIFEDSGKKLLAHAVELGFMAAR
ncbi:putative methyltransferase regulatory domain protein [Caballeronia sordidicola]|uniref:Putative methyltransferase regulatory domain protein n=1 Tax=Caballeronia sordidicola TaxID=196367 RepID=A0A158GIK9_CABSO|nr:class I SAM-dependent methyltransferase [Caballeronia sordidicola]SAL31753.1 putative methyltransferase regulatory domain protein [Caballeronia sordidicola]